MVGHKNGFVYPSFILVRTGQTHTFNYGDLFIWLIGYLLMFYVTLLDTTERLINNK